MDGYWGIAAEVFCALFASLIMVVNGNVANTWLTEGWNHARARAESTRLVSFTKQEKPLGLEQSFDLFFNPVLNCFGVKLAFPLKMRVTMDWEDHGQGFHFSTALRPHLWARWLWCHWMSLFSLWQGGSNRLILVGRHTSCGNCTGKTIS